MGKFKKRNTCGFVKSHVPHNKGKVSEREKFLPAPFKRLNRETHEVVENPPLLSEGKEMTLRPGCHRLLRPRPLRKEGEQDPLNQITDNR